MKKFFTLLNLCILLTLTVSAQQTLPVPADAPFGDINQADLEMKACDFEKDANAEILIDKANLYYDQRFAIVEERHKRIKIFNDNGKSAANIRIEFFSWERHEVISGLEAQTVNITGGKQVITKLDKNQIYTQDIDKYRSRVVFTMPDVKPGAIIEYKYTWTSINPVYIPTWYFQDEIPVRYSEFDTSIPEYLYFSTQVRTLKPYDVYSTSQGEGSILGARYVSFTTQQEKRVMFNIPSLSDEPYMTSRNDNLQSVQFHLTSFKRPYGYVQNFSDSWAKVGTQLSDEENFGRQLHRKLKGEEAIIAETKSLKTSDEKINFLFNTVKSTMKWNGLDNWYTTDGTSEAWDKRTGNSTEINLILYHLLYKSGINNAIPMLVSTRDHGKVTPAYTSVVQFNRGVVYIPVDSTKYYVLDASDKYALYNIIPYNLLNSYGLYLNVEQANYDVFFLERKAPVKEFIYVAADIQPDGKMAGSAQITCPAYFRTKNIDEYKTDGEKKFIDKLKDGDNNLTISSLKMENIDVDSLPLIENINFNMDLSGSDGNYIYFNPDILSSLHTNPFFSETRNTDIDFGYPYSITISGLYKEPKGYQADALLKNISMVMPDKSITFKRLVGESDGNITVHYVISYNKSIYFKEDYADLHEFFKQVYQMLNEQIVLKKS